MFNSTLTNRLKDLQALYELHKQILDINSSAVSVHDKNLCILQTTTNGRIECCLSASLSLAERAKQAFYAQLPARILSTLGVEHTFHVDDTIETLTLAGRMIERVLQETKPFFSRAVEVIGPQNLIGESVEAKAARLQNIIMSLGIELKLIEAHLYREREEKLGIQMPGKSVVTIQDRAADKSITFQQVECLHKLTTLFAPEIAQEIVGFLANYPERNHIAKVLLDETASNEKIQQTIKASLWRSLVLNHDKEAVEKLLNHTAFASNHKNTYQTEQPLTLAEALTLAGALTGSIHPAIQNMALVIGDSFIENSGAEGSVSASVFTDLIAKFIQGQQLDKASPQLQQLLWVLLNQINLITIQPNDDIAKICQEKVSHSPGGNCILVGGWINHNVIYEIEYDKTKSSCFSKSYTFRAHNLGDGLQFLETITPSYRTKYPSFVEIQNVPASKIFSPFFLKGLKNLQGMNGRNGIDAADLLYSHLLPLLGDPNPPSRSVASWQLMSPQGAGTCAYKSVEAFVRRFLMQAIDPLPSTPSEEGFKLFMCEFKSWLLEESADVIGRKIESPIPTKEQYKALQLEYRLVKKCLERFAFTLQKMEVYLVPDRLQTIHATLNKTQVYLGRFEQHLTVSAKKLFGWDISVFESQKLDYIEAKRVTQITRPDPAAPQRSDAKRPINEMVRSLLHQAATLPRFGSEEFWESFEAVLEKYILFITPSAEEGSFTEKPTESQVALVGNAIIKAVPQFSDWTSIKSKDLAASQARFYRAAKAVNEWANTISTARIFGIYFALVKGQEEIFQQLCERDYGARIQISCFSSHLLEKIQALHTWDSYWTRFYCDLADHIDRHCKKNVSNQRSAPRAFELPIYPPKAKFIPEQSTYCIQALVRTWWFSQMNAPLREQITASISKDRTAQKERIEKEGKTLRERSEILSLEGHAALAQLNDHVQYDKQYWHPLFDRLHQDEYTREWKYATGTFLAGRQFLVQKGILSSTKDHLLPGYLINFLQQKALCGPIFYRDPVKKVPLLQRIDFGKIPCRVCSDLDDPSNWELYACTNTEYLDPYDSKNRTPYTQGGQTDSVLYSVFPGTLKSLDGMDQTALPSHIDSLLKGSQSGHVAQDLLVEFCSIWLKADEVRIESLLIFFSTYPELLQESAWVNAFHSVLFASSVLLREVRASSKVKSEQGNLIAKLHRFFDCSIDDAIATEAYLQGANLTWLATVLQRYIQDDCTHRALETPIVISQQKLSGIVEQLFTKTRDEDRAELFEAIIAASQGLLKRFISKFKNSEQLTIDEQKVLCYCIVAFSGRTSHLLAANRICLPRAEDVEGAMYGFHDLLDVAPHWIREIVQKHMPGVLNRSFPNLNIATCIEIGTMRYQFFRGVKGGDELQDEYECILDPLRGDLIFKEQARSFVYNQSLTPHYINLLQSQKVFASSVDYSKIKCRYKAGTLYAQAFLDPNLVTQNGKQQGQILLKITQEEVLLVQAPFTPLEGQWALHACAKNDSEVLGMHLSPRYVRRLVGDTAYLVDRETQMPTFIVRQLKTQHLFEWLENGKGTGLYVANYASSTKIMPFHKFESSLHTFYLKDDTEELKAILFPRLGLTLRKQQQGVGSQENGWMLVEKPGWKVAAQQYNEALSQVEGFLVITNGQGESRLLLPCWEHLDEQQGRALGSSILKKAAGFSFIYTYDFAPEVQLNGIYFEYRIGLERDGGLVPTSLAGRYYLARILLEIGRTEEAFELLLDVDAYPVTRGLTVREQELLYNIWNKNLSLDCSPKANRVRVQALYLLEKNAFYFGGEPCFIGRINHQSKQKIVERYLQHLQKVIPLQPQEELFLLDCIPGELANKRLQELSGSTNRSLMHVTRGYYGNPLQNSVDVVTSVSSTPLPPSFWYKLKYAIARAAGRLPFDPLHVLFDSKPQNNVLQPYLMLLQKECTTLYAWESASGNYLLEALYYMAFYSEDRAVQYAAIDLIKCIPQREDQGRIAKIGRVLGAITQPQFTERRLMRASVELQDLYGTRIIKANSLLPIRLQELTEQYFIRKRSEKVSIESLDPFHETAVEIVDRTIKNKFTKASEDLFVGASIEAYEYFWKEPQQITLSLRALHSELNNMRSEEKAQLLLMEKGILKAVEQAVTYAIHSDLSLKSGKRIDLFKEEIVIHVARSISDESLKKIYPELSSKGLHELRRLVREYLVQKKQLQQVERGLEELGKLQQALQECPEQAAISVHQLATQLAARNEYIQDDTYTSIILLLETNLNLQLRVDQVENVKKFIDANARGEQVILQMIMGAGKTSVLQPLLAVLFAKEGCLSVIDVPDALYQTVVTHLTAFLGKAYNKHVYSLPYDREVAQDQKKLESFLYGIREIKASGGCLLRTPRLKHSILTSMYEAYYNLKDSFSQKELLRLETVCEILKELEASEVVQFDEIDTTLDPMVTFKYPIGIAEPIPQEHTQIIAKLLLAIAKDPAISQIYSIDFIDTFQKRFNPAYKAATGLLDEQAFESFFKPLLVEKALKILQECTKLGVLFDHFPEAKAHAKTYLLLADKIAQKQSGDTAEDSYQWLLSKIESSTLRELLGAVGHAINCTLKNSLFKECGIQYGSDPVEDKFVAKPYAAARAPKSTCFADPYEQIVYSIQLYMYMGIPIAGAKAMITSLQRDAKREVVEEMMRLSDSTAYKKFISYFPEKASSFSLLETPLTQESIVEFHKALNSQPETLIEFIQQLVSMQILLYPESVSSTPQTLLGSAKLVYGYTGTLAEGILPRSLVAIPEKGTDGKTILAVQQKMRKEIVDVKVLSEKEGKLPQQMIELLSADPMVKVLIDSGGWLKEENIQLFSINLLKDLKNRSDISGVVFHDDQGNLRVVQWSNDVKIAVQDIPLSQSHYKTAAGELFTIIAQKYETGTNIPQPANAKAFQTIRRNMTKRDALQSVFRMRKIVEGQSAYMLMSEGVRLHMAASLFEAWWTRVVTQIEQHVLSDKNRAVVIRSIVDSEKAMLSTELQAAITNGIDYSEDEHRLYSAFKKVFEEKFVPDIDSIWRYLTVNEAKIEQQKNWIAAKHKMRELFEKPFRQVLYDSAYSLEERLELFQAFSSLVVEQNHASLFERVLKGAAFEAADVVIRKEVMRYRKYMDSLNELRNVNVAASRLYLLLQNQVGLQGVVDNLSDLQSNAVMESIQSALYTCVNPDDIAEKLLSSTESPEVEMLLEQQVEQEQEVEDEAQVQIEAEVEYQSNPLAPWSRQYDTAFIGDPDYTPNHMWMLWRSGKTLGDHFLFKGYAQKMPLRMPGFLLQKHLIYSSRNLMSDGYIIDSSNLPGGYIMCMQNSEAEQDSEIEQGVLANQFVLLSDQDASNVKNGIKNQPDLGPCSIALFHIDVGLIAESRSGFFKELDPNLSVDVALIAKFTLGKTTFSKCEFQRLKEWGLTQAQGIELKGFYERVLSYKQHALQLYNRSKIKKELTAIAK